MPFLFIIMSLWGSTVLAATVQEMPGFWIDRTEVTVGHFGRFVRETERITAAEQRGGGQVYSRGWEQRSGWVWSHPFGVPGHPDEPVVHVTFDEARAFCQWRGGRLPTDAEWIEAAHVERRMAPPAPFVRDSVYPYPTGNTPIGANCLDDCGSAEPLPYGHLLDRGFGPTVVGRTALGVNGLYDMGANVWEWVDSGEGADAITRGGSWWYGAGPMHRTHRATKPKTTAVVYLGFRCAYSKAPADSSPTAAP